MYQIINGKELANVIIDELTQAIVDENLEPQLAVILVGTDPASHLYVKLKEEACKKAGIGFHKYLLPENAAEKDVLASVAFLNNDDQIDAILIQIPLPKHLEQQRIIDAMDYRKDVDGFHKKNVESLLAGKKQHLLPGLPLGIWTLLASVGIKQYQNKEALIISKSDEFSRPLAALLKMNGIVSHSIYPDAADLKETTRAADIIITAVGKPQWLIAGMIKDGAIIIDVGISKKDGKTVGDVDFDAVAPRTSFITPVPGGVGPMTVAMLLFNTVILARERRLHHRPKA